LEVSTTKAPAVLACSVTQGPSAGLRVSSTKPRLSMALTSAEVMKSCRAWARVRVRVGVRLRVRVRVRLRLRVMAGVRVRFSGRSK